MPDLLSIPEAAHKYRVSEKTLHNWINKKILEADLVLLRGRKVYLIDPATLERVMTERNMLAIPYSSVLATTSAHQHNEEHATTITTIRQRLDALERRLSLLEAALASQPHHTESESTPQAATTSERAQKTQKPPSRKIPDGYVVLNHFLHGMDDSSAGRWAKENVTPGNWIHGRHAAKYALSPEDQRAYYQWAKDKPGFQICEACPHETN